MLIIPPSGDSQQPQPSNPTEGKKKYPFSKTLLIQESILIWLVTLSCLVMAFICIATGSFVELPWITAMVGCPWAAYAITQNAYYKKSMVENSQGGIIYDGLFGASNPCEGRESTTDIPVG
jgi:hypothetical protein